MTTTTRAASYVAMALVVVLPGMLRVGGGVPGAARSDLWNSLWSWWHVAIAGLSPRTVLLDHPDGGVLLVADPVNAVLFGLLVVAFGAAVAWTAAVFAHVVFAAAAADALARELGADDDGALVAGVTFGSAPLLLSSIHGGTSEAIAWGWLPLALIAVRRVVVAPSLGRVVAAVVALWVAAHASPYLAVATWLAAGSLVAFERGPGRTRAIAALIVATMGTLPWAYAMMVAVSAPDNLVGIKDARELALVRRTIGGADPLAFLAPGDYRSPDFRRISRYGEDFIHCPYLGWVALGAAIVGFRRARLVAVLAFGVVGAALACGPVLVHDGAPVLLPGRLGVPLPYFLIERLPGFASLSLVYRLAVLASLAVALLAARATSGTRARVLAAAVFAEVMLASPMRGGPDASPLPDAAPFRAIAAVGDGAVVNWPVAGGRPYLYEATLHQRPVAGTLNFPANSAARAVLAALSDARPGEPAPAIATARARGVRFVVVHDPDADVLPGDTAAVRTLEGLGPPFAAAPGVRVWRLY